MTSAATQAKLWFWQRFSAMVLAVCVLVHLGIIIYAVRGGLSATEILARTQGNWLLGAFFSVFVLACAVHVPLGVMAIATEWLAWRGRTVTLAAALFSLAIAVMGLRAVFGVIVA